MQAGQGGIPGGATSSGTYGQYPASGTGYNMGIYGPQPGTTSYSAPAPPTRNRPQRTIIPPRVMEGPGWRYNLDKGTIRFEVSRECDFCGLRGHYTDRCPFNDKGVFNVNGVCGYCTAGDYHEGWQRRMRKYCKQIQDLSKAEWVAILKQCMALVEAQKKVPTPIPYFDV